MNIYVATPNGKERESFLPTENIEFLESLGSVVWNESSKHLTPDQLRDALPNVDVVVCGWGCPRFTDEVLQKANRLKLIAYTCGSVSNLVSDALYKRGIHVVCGNEAFARSVAEGTMAYMLTALRNIPYISRHTQERGWAPKVHLGETLLDQTVGIVGYGAISRYLLDMLRPFNVKIKLYSSHLTDEQAQKLGVQKASLEEIFSTCKVVSLHCARNPQNYHLIHSGLLAMLCDGAVLVNTARGDVIDEPALIREAQTGRIRVILDVYEQEPLPMDSGLRGLDNVILMPHQGGPTVDRRPAAARLVLDDIYRFKMGMPMENLISASRAAMMTH